MRCRIALSLTSKMKIRIQGNTVRLRLSQDEVNAIGNLQPVEEKTEFPNSSFVYQLKTHANGSEIQADFSGNKMLISLPETTAQNWANSQEVGVENHRDSKPYILIEKDFQCLTNRPHEDESNLFPNPNLTC